MADDILRWVRSSIHSHLFTVFRTFGRSFVCFFMDPSAIPANIYFGWGGWGWVGVKDRFGIVHGFLRKLWSIFRVLADISDYFQKNSFLIGFIFWNLQGFLRISPHFFFFSPFFFFSNLLRLFCQRLKNPFQRFFTCWVHPTVNWYLVV